MKKILPVLLVTAMLLSLTACNMQPTESETAGTLGSEPGVSESDLTTDSELLEPHAYTFQINRYAVSANAAEYLGNVEDYKALIDAVCAGEDSVQIAEQDDAYRAAVVFGESPYSAFADVQDTDGTLQITYNQSGDADTFDSAVKELVESVLYAESNKSEMALALYRAVASEFSLEKNGNGSLYRIMTEKKGGTAEFAAALNYLFNQCGIPSRMASGTVGESEWFWVVAEFNGVQLHFDPAAENRATEGKGLLYFGMSDEARAKAGSMPPYTTGRSDYAKTVEKLCADTQFDAVFEDVSDYEIDVLNHFVYLAYDSSEEFQNSINTESFIAAVG